MPNTKSAERRMRNSATKQLRNRSVKSRLHTLERKYQLLVNTGKTEDAGKMLNTLNSAFDKAAKAGVIHRRMAARKKSRLTVQLGRAKKS